MNPNIMMTVVFFILFIVLFTIYIYHMYDYIGHKENVDKSIEISTSHINKTFDTVSENLSATDARLSGKIDTSISEAERSMQQLIEKQDAMRSNIQDTHKTIDGKIVGLDSKSKALNAEINKLKRNFIEVGKEHSGIASDLTTLRKRMEGISVRIDAVSAKERSTNVDMRDLHKKQAEIIGFVNENKLENTRLGQKLNGFDENIKGFTNDIKSLGGNFALLNEKNTLLGTELSGVRDNYKLLDDKSNTLSTEVKAVSANHKVLDDKLQQDLKTIENSFNTEKTSISTNIKGIRDRLTELDVKQNNITSDIQAILALSLNPNVAENIEKIRGLYKALNAKHYAVKSSMDALQNMMDTSFISIAKIQGLQTILDDTEAKHKAILADIEELKKTSDNVNGLIVRTSTNLVDPKNFKVCNQSNDCMNFNTNSEGFNMTPENISRFTINSKNKTPVGKFNLENDSLYLKGNVGIGMETVRNRKLEVVSQPKGSISVIGAGDVRYHCFNEGSVQEWLWGQKAQSKHDWTLSTLNSGNEVDRLVVSVNGNVGIGTINPISRLDVIAPAVLLASFRHTNLTQGVGITYNSITAIGTHANQDINITTKGSGVIRTNGRLVVNNSVNGGPTRGIMMWNSRDSNWGMYMSQAGGGRSFAGRTACNGVNFSSHSIRLRTHNHVSNGLIYENDREQCLMSVRASDGMSYFRGKMGIGMANPTEMLHVNGNAALNGGRLHMIGRDPTIYLRDVDHRSAMIHVNSNRFYVLRGSGKNSTTWTSTKGRWPLEIDLENNNAMFGGDINYNGRLMNGNRDMIKYLENRIAALEARVGQIRR